MHILIYLHINPLPTEVYDLCCCHLVEDTITRYKHPVHVRLDLDLPYLRYGSEYLRIAAELRILRAYVSQGSRN